MKGYEIDGEERFIASQYTRERDFWLKKLSGELARSGFPYDFERIGKNERKMDAVECGFPTALVERLIKASNASDSRLHMILAAGLVQLLYKYSESRDIIIGIPIYKQDVEGDFVNTVLTLRIQLDHDMTFKDLLGRIRQTIVEANEHLNYPIESIPHELGMFYSQDDDFPLFDVTILLENIHDKNYISNIRTNMNFCFTRRGETLEGVIEYNSARYDGKTVKHIADYFSYLLRQTLFNANSAISELSVLSEEEKRQVLFDFNDTQAGYPKEITLHRLFEKQVEETPQRPAVVFGHQEITYEALNRQADRIAALLIEKGITGNSVVGIMGKRSPWIVTAILGILKAGATYLPINAKDPDDRVKFILEDSSASLLITQQHLVEEKPSLSSVSSLENILLIEDLEKENIGDAARANRESPGQPGDHVYVIYTSGTTGKTKGVSVTHRAVVNYIWWAAKQYVRGERLNFPLYTSIAFDLTVTSIFTPLLTGNAIVVYEGEGNEALIEEVFADNKVGVVKLTPSHLKLVKDKNMDGGDCRIKRLILGGENLETWLANEASENFNGIIEIYNEYGPTEATVGSMIYKFDPGSGTDNMDMERKSVPIGVPIANTRIYLLNKRLKPVPVGAIGEIYISGDGVVSGYMHRLELTAEKFVPNPFIPGNTMYRTGDLARRLVDGNIEFLGRLDHQVKIRGYRVETGEIESRLAEHDEIKEAVVTAREDRNGDTCLCGYIVSTREFPVSELREYLSRELPDYMIPSYFVTLDNIPLTRNGKLDTKALPEPQAVVEGEYIAPRDAVECKLVKIWSEILNIEESRLGIDVNFFELGGHSLNATVLVSKIHKSFNVRVPLTTIFDHSTIRGISEYLKEAAEDLFVAIEPVGEKPYYDLSHSQKRLWVLSQIEKAALTFNISGAFYLEGKLNAGAFERVFDTLIERHQSLRTVFVMVDDEPKQQILSAADLGFRLEYMDLRGIPEKENKIRQLARAEWDKSFDLSAGPLLRAKLARLEEEKYAFLFTMHHIISDALSMDVVLREVLTLYYSYDAGKESPLRPLNIQYKDYAAWHNDQLQGEKIDLHKNYWLEHLQGKLPLLELPADKERPAVMTYNGGAYTFPVDEALTGALRTLSKQSDATLFMVLLTALKILLSRITGQEDVIIGIPISGREHADLEGQIGFFLNTLPLRTRLGEDETFVEVLRNVKNASLKAYEHQVYPFDLLVDRLGIQRDVSRHPVFDVVVDMINYNFSEFNIEDDWVKNRLEISAVGTDSNKSKFDLTLYVYEGKTSMDIKFEYYADLFEFETIEHLAKCYQVLLASIVENPTGIIADLTYEEEVKISTLHPIVKS